MMIGPICSPSHPGLWEEAGRIPTLLRCHSAFLEKPFSKWQFNHIGLPDKQ